jgi:hypothetical protein
VTVPDSEQRISAHTKDEGWPFNAGDLVYWFDTHSNRLEGYYLRINIDDLEECWGDEAERNEFTSRMEGSDSECLECGAELDDETGECVEGCEPFDDHPQEDDIRFATAYGVRARVIPVGSLKPRHDPATGQLLPAWPPDEDDEALEHPTEVPLSQIYPVIVPTMEVL